MLITCPDCKKQVSDKAPACPECGRPAGLQPDKFIKLHNGKTVKYAGSPKATRPSIPDQKPKAGLEFTSKALKAQGCFALVIFFAGVLIFGYGATGCPEKFRNTVAWIGMVIAGIGAVYEVVVRIRIWWHHD